MNEIEQLILYFEHAVTKIEDLDFESIACATNILRGARTDERRVWLAGNGGSAATASHFSNDLRKMCHIDATSLPNDISTILAYGNDEGWENMFSGAMEPFNAGDVLIAISCSGASMNVIRAAWKAERRGGYIIALTGPVTKKNQLMLLAHPAIVVNSLDIKVQEDLHLMICHSIAGVLAI